ncbi:carbohydrate binding domain-containing protein [Teredinibacter purpureus]|uniref:carbohydrate binding domain-containing protein n=1 Tax=Teredinibacter purpureus TaxID=2731756 RepID=UPI0005F81710|nr:carbohydrate binding domain-containing protein [Teredinibacter purpureus]
MLGKHRKTRGVLVGLIALEVLLGYMYWVFAEVRGPLLPAPHSFASWDAVIHNDQRDGGASVIAVGEATYGLDFTYTLSSSGQYPYADFIMAFDKLERAERLLDLSEYSRVAFKVKCAHENVLSFNLRLFEPNHTLPEDYHSYRVSTSWFSCSNRWTSVEINLSDLRTPVWWHDANNIPLSNQAFQLDQILAISFGGERRGPVDIETNVNIIDLVLLGGNWRYASVALLLMVIVLAGGGYWLWVLCRNTGSVLDTGGASI